MCMHQIIFAKRITRRINQKLMIMSLQRKRRKGMEGEGVVMSLSLNLNLITKKHKPK